MRAFWVCLIAGWADAVAYLQAKMFAAQMSGNVVLLGIAVAHRAWNDCERLLLVLVAFVTGMLIVLLVNRGKVGQIVSILGCAAGMAAVALTGKLASLAPLLAACLGGQNAAVRKSGGQAVNTSFITGNMQKFADAVAKCLREGGTTRDQRLMLLIVPLLVCCYLTGAAAGALSDHYLALPLLPPALLLPFALLLPE